VSTFKPGDEVEYCGERAVVVENYGECGIVEIPGEGCMTWRWKFDGESVNLARKDA
jgi:hypothetical protein